MKDPEAQLYFFNYSEETLLSVKQDSSIQIKNLIDLDEDYQKMLLTCIQGKRLVSNQVDLLLPNLSMFGQSVGFLKVDNKVNHNSLALVLTEMFKFSQILEMNLVKLHSQQDVNFNSVSSHDSLKQFRNQMSTAKSNTYENLMNKTEEDERSKTFEIIDINLNDSDI